VSKDAFIEEEWDRFCDQLGSALKAAGRVITEASGDILDRDEGLRMLLRQLRYSTEREIEEWDVDHPVFAPVYTTTYHTLADPPDYASFDALVSGAHDYLLTGHAGEADEVNFTTFAPRSALPAADRKMPELWSGGGSAQSDRGAGKEITGTLDLADCDIDADGHFSITLSARKPEHGAWLPMTPATDRVVVRNIYHGAYREHQRRNPAQLSLTRVGASSTPPPYATATLLSSLNAILRGLNGPTHGRGKIVKRIKALGNASFSNDDTFWKMSGSNPRTHFQEAYWEIGPEEAIVIEMKPPPGAGFWCVGLTNAWMESLDFRYGQVNLNSASATSEPDGSVRILIAQRDPGLPNWLDTQGHGHGTILWRWNDMAEKPPLPLARRISLKSLKS
jgi:hypothetical protein